MNDPILIYINTDDKGKVIDKAAGRNMIPTKPYQYFFITFEQEAMTSLDGTLDDYRNWQNKSFPNA